jgi:hypothetical protein
VRYASISSGDGKASLLGEYIGFAAMGKAGRLEKSMVMCRCRRVVQNGV